MKNIDTDIPIQINNPNIPSAAVPSDGNCSLKLLFFIIKNKKV